MTDRSERIRESIIERYQREYPELSAAEAYDMYIQDMRLAGRKGGLNGGRPFRDVPGLAKRAKQRSDEVKREKKRGQD